MSTRLDAHTTDAMAQQVIALVHLATGVDFSGYRQPMLRRRVDNHMIAAGIATPAAYLEQLRTSPQFAREALERFTIKVSRFFRNPPLFDWLRRELFASDMLPRSVWSAGAGEGEEPYTFAMLLDESGGDGDVVATDIDTSALARGAAGFFSEPALETLPAPWRERYVEQHSVHGAQMRSDLRAKVHFTHHDLTANAPPPPGPFDVVSCRNVLIYLDRTAQECALRHLLSPLKPGGILVLGEAEWPLAASLRHLTPMSSVLRVFRHAPNADAT